MDVNHRDAWRALFWATLTFAANFSVWTLYAVLALHIQTQLNLSALQLGVLLSSPILSGAVLRIPLGVMSEYISARALWILIMWLQIPPLLLLPWVNSFAGFVCLGLWIGVSGATFTLGVRYVSEWFGKQQQGLALGVFGVGNAGAAMSFLLIPLLANWYGWQWVGPWYALAMLPALLLFTVFAPKLPAQRNNQKFTWREDFSFIKDAQVWRFGLYYFFVFGSFLALVLWLPSYYMQVYDLNVSQAMAFTLLFVITSSMVRALGGWFADRYGARTVNWSVFWICLVCLFFLSYPPTSMTIHGLERDVVLRIEVNIWLFTGLIFVIGLAQGLGRASVMRALYDHYPQQMGSVGGWVAFLGAMGGFILPLAFGFTQDLLGIASGAFMVLYAVLALCMLLMFFAIRRERYQKALQQALMSDFYADKN